MTPRERVLAHLQGRPVDRLPFMPITMQLACRLVGARYHDYATDEESIRKSKVDARDVVILDTAGRLHIDESLMTELVNINTKVLPKEVILVADAMTGQDAVTMAKNFDEHVGIDGIILTKLDGDARGGAALSIRTITGKPIKFIGVGEKIDMLEPCYPDRIASRILGMGDVLSLIEQAQKPFDQKEAEKLQKAIIEESFTFEDLREHLKKLRNMGPLENILNMIPGFNKMKNIEVDEKELVKVEAIINSMTKKERKNHAIIDGHHFDRLALLEQGPMRTLFANILEFSMDSSSVQYDPVYG